MKLITKHIASLALTASALTGVAVLSSCEHKDLCYYHVHTSHLKVVYDWSEAPDANPAGMCAFFYSLDRDGEYHRFDFSDINGGYIDLPIGRYVLISYNNDTEMVQFSATDDFDSHKAFTREGDLLEPLYGNGVTSSATTDNGERVVITPDQMWGCTATDITVTEYGVTYTVEHHHQNRANDNTEEASDDQVITLYPNDKLCHYTYEVRNVKNIRHISKVSGSISGMAPSLNLKDDSLDTEPVTHPVPGQANVSTDKITGSFLTFGHNSSNGAKHRMAFYLVMDDGTKYSYKDAANLDVTQQVDTASDRRHVHIIIDGMNLPDVINSDEGFNTSVDEWGVHEEDLNI